MGTVTRNWSNLISSFIGGFTSIVRRGPCGRPLLLAKRDVDDNDGHGDDVNDVDDGIERGALDDSGAFVWTVNAVADPLSDAVMRKARVDNKFIFIFVLMRCVFCFLFSVFFVRMAQLSY